MISSSLEAYGSLASAARPPRPEQASEVAEGFESLFLHQLLEPLERTGEALFGSGAEGRTFSGLFRQVLADQLAKARPLGIADQVEASLRRQQGDQNRLPEGGIQA